MQAAYRLSKALFPLSFAVLLAACGGATAPASTTPASSPAVAASKPAAAASAPAVASSAASAKPAASGVAASGAASAKPAASGAASAAASAKPAASASGVPGALPALPAPVAVSVDAKTSALLVLDFNSAVCQPNPACVAVIPTISGIIKKARDANVPVVYSTTGTPPSAAPTLASIAPQSGDQTVAGRADKFINTDLDSILKKTGAKTLVMTGTAANGAVMYTAFHANALGYTVAVPVDAIVSGDPVATSVAEWQMLNEPGFTNADNKVLPANQVTLTRTDQVTFK